MYQRPCVNGKQLVDSLNEYRYMQYIVFRYIVIYLIDVGIPFEVDKNTFSVGDNTRRET